MKKTVFVLGAGASCEVGLPIGSELTDSIADKLDIAFDFDRLKHGDPVIAEAYHVLRAQSQVDPNQLRHAGLRIREAMPLARSIDNFLDQHKDDEFIVRVGKLAIVRCILAAEGTSDMKVDTLHRDGKINQMAIRHTWYNALWKALAENCSPADLEGRLESVAFVVFNYDRCLEHFFFNALRSNYGLNETTASAVAKKLQVLRPYGRIGSLPWQQQDDPISYGEEASAAKIIQLADQIKTFTESTDQDAEHIKAIRSAMIEARRVIFLGFAFHPLNLELLWGNNKLDPVGRSGYATAYKISDSDAKLLAAKIKKWGGLDYLHMSNTLTCAVLFAEHQQGISFSRA